MTSRARVLAVVGCVLVVAAAVSNAGGNATGYDAEFALWGARLASASYCANPDRLAAWDCESCHTIPGVKVVTVFERLGCGAYGFIAVQGNWTILSFRGTSWDDFGSAWDDLLFDHVRWPQKLDAHSRVNRGFLRYYNCVDEPIRRVLSGLATSYPSNNLAIVGHSLGASVALIASVALLDIFPSPVVYTYGTPRTGNYAFSVLHRRLVPNSWRVVHDCDMVPHLAPCGSFMDSRCSRLNFFPFHTSQEVFYDQRSMHDIHAYTVCDPLDGEDDTCSNRLRFPDSIFQHRHYFAFDLTRQCK
ncbi:Fungal lipase-like domain-containing protein [Plasmodiophora brassicae]|uniref:Fungal lipase-type domain-containing protein n=1 Tax=Plasmodiophora brassicae TaxID=37360 RepID=A0A0G4IKR8_PLABS|nr:hypothetical protein PBRA_004564 [Plasmodiophora brassicae]SPR00131.1 unnamed protein product [Plasmodiophora brassicae]